MRDKKVGLWGACFAEFPARINLQVFWQNFFGWYGLFEDLARVLLVKMCVG